MEGLGGRGRGPLFAGSWGEKQLAGDLLKSRPEGESAKKIGGENPYSSKARTTEAGGGTAYD